MSGEPERAGDLWVVNPAGQQETGWWIDDTLKRRQEERGLMARTPLAGNFPRQRVELVRGPDAERRVDELFEARGWSDGLPVVAPSVERVAAMLRGTPLPRATLLGAVEPLRGLATLEKVAANAVMAGCRPGYFPVVIAAVSAILDPAFNLRGVQTTDENVAPLLVVNGPVRQAIGLNGGFGALGPGWRANATIGRAVRLVMNNLGGGWPAAVSFAGIGQAARYTFCFAENEEQSPWPPLHVECGFAAAASVVSAMRAETAINVTGGIEEVASVMGSAASAFTIAHGGKVAVILAPAVAAGLAARGLTKRDVKARLHALGRWSAAAWRGSFLAAKVLARGPWPGWALRAAEAGAIPPVESPDDIVLIVAGGDVPIPQNVYCPSWGFPPALVQRQIECAAPR